MEIFALDLAVREKGAATVEAALAGVKKEAQAVATSVTAAGQSTQQAMTRARMVTAANAGSMANLHAEALKMNQVMGQGTPAALGRTATSANIAAIRVTHLATQFAATGNVSIAAIGGIEGALKKLGVSIGPAGVLAAGVVALATIVTSQMAKMRAEVKKTTDAIQADTQRMLGALNAFADEQDRAARERALRRVREGTGATRAIGSEGMTAEEAEARGLVQLRSDLGGLNRQLERARDLDAQWRSGIRATATMTAGEFAGAVNTARDTIKRLEPTVVLVTSAIGNLEKMEKQFVTTLKTDTVDLTEVIARRSRELLKEVNVWERLRQAREDARRSAAEDDLQNIITNGAPLKLPPLKPLGRGIVPPEFFSPLEKEFMQGVSAAITGGFAAGIAEGIASGNFGKGFNELTASILSGFGSAAIQFGIAQIKIGVLMKAALKALETLNPVAAIAVGAALVGLGRMMGGAAKDAFGASAGRPLGATAGGGSASETVTRVIFGPTTSGLAAGMTPQQWTNITVIGPNDPTAQRAIEEILRKANRRGGLGG